MDPDFWHARWQANQIAFHEGEANHLLVRHFATLGLAPGSRVFVPLCGKTRDIAWLLSIGLDVVAVELSEVAIEQLFDDLGSKPTIARHGPLRHYSSANLAVYVGDLFDLTAAMTGPVSGVYDRAALVALPTDMRTRYAAHVRQITAGAPQLMICFEYDQSQMDGPPFSITRTELQRLYDGHHAMTLLETRPVQGGLKGQVPAQEAAWLLR
jgi:thiopurine S-methyltransferase